jgi:hypothetical protein
VAIGAIGVVLLLMNVAGLGVGAVIVFGVVLSVIWTLSGAAMYRAYTKALAGEMRRHPLAASGQVAEDDAALQALLRSDDARDVRLGLDLLSGASSPAAAGALREATKHGDPEVRMEALVQLAAAGDEQAAAEAGALAAGLAHSADPAGRRAAAAALEVSADRSLLATLIDDADPTVRAAALEAVQAGDGADPAIIQRVVAALEEPRCAGSATGALRRLGDPAVPLLAEALTRATARRPALVRAAAQHGLAVVEPALRDPDRVVVLVALDALTAAGADVPADVLDGVFDDAARHATRTLAARQALAAEESPVRRALEDETELARRLVIAVLSLRHGEGVRNAVRVVERADGQRRALGVEALDVLITREEAAVALPLVSRDAAAPKTDASPARSAHEWTVDMADDPERVWRSPWLARCARHELSA